MVWERGLAKKEAFKASLLGGAASLLLSLAMRITINSPYLPEMAAQALFSLTPGSIESVIVGLLGELAKYLAVMGASIINVLVLAVLGALISMRVNVLRGSASIYILTSASLLLNSALYIVFSSVSDVATVRASPLELLIHYLPPSITFGYLTKGASHRFLETKRVELCEPRLRSPNTYRRRILIMASSLGAVASAMLLYGILPSLIRAPNYSFKPRKSAIINGDSSVFNDGRLANLKRYEVTPKDLFYRVDINIIPPRIDPSRWLLKINGLVKEKISLSLDEIRSLPSISEYATLECVSNKIGGDLISTAKWKGVRLRDVLELTGIEDGARYIVFRCADGYDVGIPLERGLMEGTILAYEMNGEPLPIEHGFPIRVIVPGYYGMMNAKWVEEIELVGETYEGFWQRRGWANEAEYKTHSTILIPGSSPARRRFRLEGGSRVVAGEENVIAGIAFAGDRGIERVEVSVDGGSTWEEASIKDPLSNYTWVIWAAKWIPSEGGNYRLLVRATDKNGRVQTAEVRRPFPSGATGYHIVDITVL